MPPRAVLVTAPALGPSARGLEIAEALAGEAVVADVAHRPLDARLVLRPPGRAGSMTKPRSCTYSWKTGFVSGSVGSARCTTALRLSMMTARKIPP